MAATPRAPLRKGLAGRVWVDLTRPADSLAPGQVPAQEARWPGDAKRVMSAPVSAMITSATPVLMPGTCPGANESAGRVKSTHTRPANPYLKGALGVAAMAAARTKGTYLAAKH